MRTLLALALTAVLSTALTPATPAASESTSTADSFRIQGLQVYVAAPRDVREKIKIVVTGPGSFRKVLTRDDDYRFPDARPGVYEVSARQFRWYDQPMQIRVRPDRVRVTDGEGARVYVTYEMPVLCRAAGGGTVRSWGAAESGQVGSPTTSTRKPTTMPDLHGITEVVGGHAHAIGRCHDGTVWTWGSDSYGQLGNGASSTASKPFPVKVQGLTDVTGVAAHDRGGVAVTESGEVWSWGWAEYGQLGDGEPYDGVLAHRPVQVEGISTATAVAAAGHTSYALLADGTVRAWGSGALGQLGNGDNEDSEVPVVVTGLAGVTQLAAGHDFGLALLGDGSVRAWGNGAQGQLGNGDNSSSSVPVTVATEEPIREIAAGFAAGYARTTGQELLAWGSQRHGALGNGTVANTFVDSPVSVPLTGVLAIAAYGYSAYAFADTSAGGGDAVAWGDNSSNQLATGAPVTTGSDGVPDPEPVQNLPAGQDLGAGIRNGYFVG